MKWLFEIKIGSGLITFYLCFISGFCRKQNNLNMRSCDMTFKSLHQFVTIHLWHHYIADNHIRKLFERHIPSFQTIMGQQNPKFPH